MPMKLLCTVILATLPCFGQGFVPGYSTQRVDALARAIGRAEGFDVKGSKPARKHNPGDLKQAGSYRVFRSDAAGWEALRVQLVRVVAGQSRQYRLGMTIQQMGRRYAGSPLWAANVAKALHVPANTKLEDFLCDGYLDMPPQVVY